MIKIKSKETLIKISIIKIIIQSILLILGVSTTILLGLGTVFGGHSIILTTITALVVSVSSFQHIIKSKNDKILMAGAVINIIFASLPVAFVIISADNIFTEFQFYIISSSQTIERCVSLLLVLSVLGLIALAVFYIIAHKKTKNGYDYNISIATSKLIKTLSILFEIIFLIIIIFAICFIYLSLYIILV